MAHNVIVQPTDAKSNASSKELPVLQEAFDHSEPGQLIDWRLDEERLVVRNGNALTDNFLKDVGITQNWFNVGQQLLNAGIVLLEIPSNVILYRVGPKAWIGCQIMAWGLVSIFQAWQKGLGAFLATRTLLGLLESGFIPGCLYTLSSWYKVDELSKRFGFFFLGNGIAQACGGLIAYGILHMRGVAGLTGWQWLFIIEGLSTILAGAIFIVLFPGLPQDPMSLLRVCYFSDREKLILMARLSQDPMSLLRVCYFSDREKLILMARLSQDEATRQSKSRRISSSNIVNTFAHPKIWLHVIVTISGLAPTTALWSYAPTIVRSFGYERLAANAMVSIGQWISVCLIVVAGFAADKTGRRGFVVLFGVMCQWIFMVAFAALPHKSSAGLKFGILTMGSATCSWWHSVHGSWLAINSKSPEERAMRMAAFIMSANCAGIVGAQLFRSDDLPYYERGWSIVAALLSLTLALVAVLLIWYHRLNSQKEKLIHFEGVASEQGTGTPNGNRQEELKLYNY